jgi:DeoR family transcriptional regulator of aga operon
MVKHAAKVILLMDSSKMNKQTLSHVCDLSSVHTLVTDSGIAAADRERLEKLGIRVEVVTK